MQKEDFKGILDIMGGLPVTIRTLDPPLHEFLPHRDDEIVELAQVMGVPADRLRAKVKVLQDGQVVATQDLPLSAPPLAREPFDARQAREIGRNRIDVVEVHGDWITGLGAELKSPGGRCGAQHHDHIAKDFRRELHGERG